MKQNSLAEKAYQSIKDAIITGVLKPGEMLNERGLAARFDLSKTPVRESLHALQNEGLVTSIPRAGYMVTQITLRELQDWFQVRLILETAAVELTAGGAAQEAIQNLEKISKFSYAHLDIQSYKNFLKANTNFHYQVALSSGNLVLAGMVLEVLEKLERAFHLELAVEDRSQEMVDTHTQLVDALKAGDAARAVETVRQEILSSQERTARALSMKSSLMLSSHS
jgi:DNA-binding GntR family transcriptional regulator